jgi:hypothetical protein
MARAPLYQLPGRPIAYFPTIVPYVGSVNAAVVLCQLVYWTPRAKNDQGWIYKTQLELMQETGLSRHEQRAAREVLKDRDLLEERYDRVNHQLYLRINVEVYNAMVAALCDNPVILPHIRKSDMPGPKSGRASFEKRINPGRKTDFDNNVVAEIPESTPDRETVAHATRPKKCARDGCTQLQCPHWQQCRAHADCELCAAADAPDQP